MTIGEGKGNWFVNHKLLGVIILGGLVLVGLTWLAVREPSASTATTTGSESATSVSSGGDVVSTGGTDGVNDDGSGDSSGNPASDSAGGTTGTSSGGAGSTDAASPTVPTLSTVTNSKSFGAVAYDSVSATCPAGTVAVGGGFRGAESTRFFASYLTDNGWFVRGVNGSLTRVTVYAYVQCVANITGSISTATATSSIGGLSNGTTSKNCPSGTTLVSGGFDNTENGLIMTFSNKVDNGWRVNATSDAIAAQTLKVLTNCYSGTVSLTQFLATDSVPAGWTWTKAKSCDSGLLVSAGVASQAETYSSYFNTPDSKWVTAVNNKTDAATNFKAYFYCAAFST